MTHTTYVVCADIGGYEQIKNNGSSKSIAFERSESKIICIKWSFDKIFKTAVHETFQFKHKSEGSAWLTHELKLATLSVIRPRIARVLGDIDSQCLAQQQWHLYFNQHVRNRSVKTTGRKNASSRHNNKIIQGRNAVARHAKEHGHSGWYQVT